MVETIRVDSNTHTYRDGSLYVIEQHEHDVLESVAWRAVKHEDATFAAPMRADYILIHDREVGVIIPRRTAHAYYRFAEKDLGRRYDQFGDTWLHIYTKALVERRGASGTLVNIEYLAGPTRRSFPALPKIEVSGLGLAYGDIQMVGV